MMYVFAFDYYLDYPRFVEGFKIFLEQENSLIVIREEMNAFPDILWRPTFKPGTTYNPYGPPEQIPNYYRLQNATELIEYDW